jgi:hypothetical protein
MSTTGHLELFSIMTDHKSPIEDELPRPTQKLKKHPNSNYCRHTMFGRGIVEQEHCTSATATTAIKYLNIQVYRPHSHKT